MADRTQADEQETVESGEVAPKKANGAGAFPSAFDGMSPPQKAAAVIVSLGVEKASLLYQYMDAEEIEQVTLEVAKLGMLDAGTTEGVLDEFYQMCMTNKAVTEGGLEYAKTVLEQAFGARAVDQGYKIPQKPRVQLYEQGG